MNVSAVIVAGGNSARLEGDVPKQFREVAGKPLLSWSISRFEAAVSITTVVVVVAEEYLLYTSERVIDPFGFHKVQKVVAGGESRQDSVRKGLESLAITTDYVAIHDGARPIVKPEDIDRVVEAAMKSRAAILASPVADTLKRVREGHIITTVDRTHLYGAQTPQVFQYDLIMEAHRATPESPEGYTDDASMVESRGFAVTVVEPTGPNFKVTTREDLMIAEALLGKEHHG